MAKSEPIIELLTVISETNPSYLPHRLAKAQKAFLNAGQRQDSTTDQLNTLKELARMAGCYDAIDALELLAAPLDQAPA